MKVSLDKSKLTEINLFCDKNPTNISELIKCKNFLLDFIKRYNESLPTVKTRGKKRVCIRCSTLFYDLGRNSNFCMKHIVTPNDQLLLTSLSKIEDYIERNTTEKIFTNEEWNIDDNLRSLFRYHPDIDKCWKFKDCIKEVIQNVYSDVDNLICKNVIICTVPSHDPTTTNTGNNQLVKLLAGNGRIDGSKCLVRTKKVAKKGKGGDRDKSVDLNSIITNNSNIFKDKSILLLDDVALTGNSMRACSEILKKSGAKRVSKLAIWKAGSHT
ncbi:phosphoribosyltransferase family protein [Alphaproteobacteria bacterium]|nr:phosphoribosyltransferase family protein [Alphaproteobacteria bacterium]